MTQPMFSASLICPQCGGPLPRQARWRSVICTYCGISVSRAENFVEAAPFHQAFLRTQPVPGVASNLIRCQGQHYKTLLPLGFGTSAKVMLAERVGALTERVVLKLANQSALAGRLKKEMAVLQQLQAIAAPGAAYFSQRLPQPVACGVTESVAGESRDALVLRHPAGFWGSLANVKQLQPLGLDPRHVVWMWRRVLEVLAYLHDAGWVHGNLSPEHMLVHPKDHGILLIGWAGAQQVQTPATAGILHPAMVRDLMQSAWAMRVMLADGDAEPSLSLSTPAALEALLKNASEDRQWCTRLGARGLDQALAVAARSAFGPSRFIHFNPHSTI
ncbi:MAG: lipopolysaccharide kinase InaA family protein [Pseudomonadota bacterium]